MNLIDRLKVLYEERYREIDDIDRWNDAIEDAWPKLLAFVQAYDEFTNEPQTVDMKLYDRMYDARKALDQET